MNSSDQEAELDLRFMTDWERKTILKVVKRDIEFNKETFRSLENSILVRNEDLKQSSKLKNECFCGWAKYNNFLTKVMASQCYQCDVFLCKFCIRHLQNYNICNGCHREWIFIQQLSITTVFYSDSLEVSSPLSGSKLVQVLLQKATVKHQEPKNEKTSNVFVFDVNAIKTKIIKVKKMNVPHIDDKDTGFFKIRGEKYEEIIDEVSSLYSESCYDNEYVVTGSIKFGVWYKEPESTLYIRIDQATKLAHKVDESKINPYVNINLLPGRSKHTKRKTSIHRHTASTHYDEIVKIKISREDVTSNVLWLSIWNWRLSGRNSFLGEVFQPLSETDLASSKSKTLKLRKKEKEVDDECTDSPYHNGKLHIDLKFESKTGSPFTLGTLFIRINKAEGLHSTDVTGDTNPFVRCFLLPNTSMFGKKKSKIISKELNPVWDEEYSYAFVSLEDLYMTRALEVTVWDSDRRGMNSFMGGIRLGPFIDQENKMVPEWMDSSEEELSHWNKMLEHKGEWVKWEHALRSSMTSLRSTQFAKEKLLETDEELEETEEVEISDSESIKEAEIKAEEEERQRQEQEKRELEEQELERLELEKLEREKLELEKLELEKLELEKESTEGLPKLIISEIEENATGEGLQDLSDDKNTEVTPEKEETEADGQLLLCLPKDEQGNEYVSSPKPPHLTLNRRGRGDGCNISGGIEVRADYYGGVLEVKILKATSIAGVCQNGAYSDPFVRLYLLPDTESKRKTKTQRKTRNPIYNETFKFPISMEDLRESTLWVTIWSYSRWQDKFLGEICIPFDQEHYEFSDDPNYRSPAITYAIEDYSTQRTILEPSLTRKRSTTYRIDTKIRKEASEVLNSTPNMLVIEERNANVGESFEESEDTATPETMRRSHSVSRNPPSFEFLAAPDSDAEADLEQLAEDKESKCKPLPSQKSVELTLSRVGKSDGYSISGEIEVGIHYNGEALVARIVKASNIAGVNQKGTESDAFLQLHLLPHQESKMKTKTIKKTRNPIFNETFKFSTSMKDLLDSTLWLTMWSYVSRRQNKFLGEICIPFDREMYTFSADPDYESIPVNYTLQDYSNQSMMLQPFLSRKKTTTYRIHTQYRRGTFDVHSLAESKKLNANASDSGGENDLGEIKKDIDGYLCPSDRRLSTCISSRSTPEILEKLSPVTEDSEKSSPSGEVEERETDDDLHQLTKDKSTEDSLKQDEIKPATFSEKTERDTDEKLKVIAEDKKSKSKSLPSEKPQNFTLKRRGKSDGYSISGEIEVGVDYNGKALVVRIVKASNIAGVNQKGVESDPYVKLCLLPHKDSKKKTKIIKKTRNPTFNETFKFPISMKKLLDSTLWITVWSDIRSKQDKFIGEIGIPFDPDRYTFSADPSYKSPPVKYILQDYSNQRIILEPPLTRKDSTVYRVRTRYRRTSAAVSVQSEELNVNSSDSGGDNMSEIEEATEENLHPSDRRPSTSIAAEKCGSSPETLSQIPPIPTNPPAFDLLATLTSEIMSGKSNPSGEKEKRETDDNLQQLAENKSKEDSSSLVKMKPVAFSEETERNTDETLNELAEDKSTKDAFKQDEIKPMTFSERKIDEKFLSAEDKKSKSKSLPSGKSQKLILNRRGKSDGYSISGEIEVGVDYNGKALVVRIVKASNIAGVNQKGVGSDPYVKLCLLPHKDSKKKTKIIKKTRNPIFNETFKFPISMKKLLDSTLWLTVWSYVRSKQDKFIGEIGIPFDPDRYTFSADPSYKSPPVKYILQDYSNQRIILEPPLTRKDSTVYRIRTKYRRASAAVSVQSEELNVHSSDSGGESNMSEIEEATEENLCSSDRRLSTSITAEKCGSTPETLSQIPPIPTNPPAFDLLAKLTSEVKSRKSSPSGEEEERETDVDLQQLAENKSTEDASSLFEMKPVSFPEEMEKSTDKKLKELAEDKENKSYASPKPPELSLKRIGKGDGYSISGEIEVGVDYDGKALVVRITKASNVAGVYHDGTHSDPFVKLYLLPHKESKRKTKIVKKTQNPIFNETFKFPILMEDLLDSTLWLTLWSYARARQNKFLGEICIPFDRGTHTFSDDPHYESAPVKYILQDYSNQRMMLEPSLTRKGTTTYRIRTEIESKPPEIIISAPDMLPSEELNANASDSDEEPFLSEAEEDTDRKICPSDRRMSSTSIKKYESTPETTKSSYSEVPVKPDSKAESTKSGPSEEEEESKINEDLQQVAEDKSIEDSSNLVGIKQLSISEEMERDTEEKLKILAEDKSTEGSFKHDEIKPMSFPEETGRDTDKKLKVLAEDKEHKSKSLPLRKPLELTLKRVGKGDGYSISGEIEVGVDYNGKALVVRIIKASNIAGANQKGAESDPYVKVYLLPNKDSKKKTKIIKKTRNPIFNETFKFPISMEDLLDSTVWLTVWSYSRARQNKFLGEICIPFDRGTHTFSDDPHYESAPVKYILQDYSNQSMMLEPSLTRKQSTKYRIRTEYRRGSADVRGPAWSEELNVNASDSEEETLLCKVDGDNEGSLCPIGRRPSTSFPLKKDESTPETETHFAPDPINPSSLEFFEAESKSRKSSPSGEEEERETDVDLQQPAEDKITEGGIQPLTFSEEMERDTDEKMRHCVEEKSTEDSLKRDEMKPMTFLERVTGEKLKGLAEGKPTEDSHSQEPEGTVAILLEKSPEVSSKHDRINWMMLTKEKSEEEFQEFSEDKGGKSKTFPSQNLPELTLSRIGKSDGYSISGEIEVGLHYNEKTLVVRVMKASNIAGVNQKGTESDTFAKLYLLPDREWKKKTKIQKKTRNPIYNETFKFPVSMNVLMDSTLWLTMWSYARARQNKFLGEICIPFDQETYTFSDDPNYKSTLVKYTLQDYSNPTMMHKPSLRRKDTTGYRIRTEDRRISADVHTTPSFLLNEELEANASSSDEETSANKDADRSKSPKVRRPRTSTASTAQRVTQSLTPPITTRRSKEPSKSATLGRQKVVENPKFIKVKADINEPTYDEALI